MGDFGWPPGEAAVNILRVNRNAICIADSDKRKANDRVNDTKHRIVDEVQALGGYAWVTSGREIENYIPDAVLAHRFPRAPSVELTQFASIADLIESIDPEAAARFIRSKPTFAAEVVPLLDRSMLENQLDLKERLDGMCAVIREWNGLEIDTKSC